MSHASLTDRALVFLALPAAATVGAFTLPGVAWKVASGITAAWLTVGFATFGAAWEKSSPRTGLVQRAIIVPGWTWVAAVFVHFATR